MKNLATLLLATAFLFQSCGNGTGKKDEIVEITRSVLGGDTPIAEQKYIITKDSVHYKIIAHDSTRNITKSYANTKQDWEKLVNSIDFEDFKNIKNGTSHQPFDGSDAEITIKTDKEEITKLNADKDESWAKIQKHLFETYYQPYVKENKETKEVAHPSFKKSVFKILEAYNQKDEEKINQFISKEYNVAILFRRGALDNITFTESIEFSFPIPEYLSYDYGLTKYDDQIKFEQLPEYDCSSERWDKPFGIYTDTLTIDISRSTTAKNENKFEISNWSEKMIAQIEEIEKASRKIIVVGKNGGTFIFFVTQNNGNWYLTGIDRFEDCSA